MLRRYIEGRVGVEYSEYKIQTTNTEFYQKIKKGGSGRDTVVVVLTWG